MIRPLIAVSLVLLASLACTAPKEHTAPDPAEPSAVSAPTLKALRFEAQAGWVTESPTSNMRKAQFRLPGVAGAEDASLVVYHFGANGGGGVEANLERWAGQFEQPDGSRSEDALERGGRSVNGMEVTEVRLGGTYVAETSPGSGEHVRAEGWLLLAAILEAPEGAYYVKLVGPEATVEHWERSYRSFLESTLR